MKICTSIQQSKELINLGLDASTANIAWDLLDGDEPDEKIPFCYPSRFMIEDNEFIPAWDATALSNLLPSDFTLEGNIKTTTYEIHIRKYRLTADVDVYQIAYGNYSASGTWSDMINTPECENLVDAMFEMIKRLLKNKIQLNI